VSEDEVAAAIQATDFATTYQGGETSFRRAGRVGDWRTRLGLVDRMLFQLASRSALVDLGYETSRWWWLGNRVARRPGAIRK
jgi:hypothetical protein